MKQVSYLTSILSNFFREAFQIILAGKYQAQIPASSLVVIQMTTEIQSSWRTMGKQIEKIKVAQYIFLNISPYTST